MDLSQELLSKILPLTGKRAELIEAVSAKTDTVVFGCSQAESAVIATVSAKNILYIAPDFVSAQNIYDQVRALSDNVILLPIAQDILTYRRSESNTEAIGRTAALHRVREADRLGQPTVIVASCEALTNLYPHEGVSLEAGTYVRGNEYSQAEIVSVLVRAGYKRVTRVEAVGQLAVRGDILDICDPLSGAVRLEFFGDTLESIRELDLEHMTSKGERASVAVVACSSEQLSADEAERAIDRLQQAVSTNTTATAGGSVDASVKLSELISEISLRVRGGDCSAYKYLLPYLCRPYITLTEFLPVSYTVFVQEPKLVRDNLSLAYNEAQIRFGSLILRGEVLPRALESLAPIDTLDESTIPKVSFVSVGTLDESLGEPKEHKQRIRHITMVSPPLSNYTRNMGLLYDDIRGWIASDRSVVLCAPSTESQRSLTDALRQNEIYVTGGKLSVVVSPLPYGYVDGDSGTVVIGNRNLFARSRKLTANKASKNRLTALPKAGDYVVHSQHGIGLCQGVVTLTTGDYRRDYVAVVYELDGKLYVPIENLDNLSLYLGGEQKPKLNRLGGSDWVKAKQRVKKSVKAMAFDLVKLYGERSTKRGYAYGRECELLDEFEAAFEHTETEDQLTAIGECLEDLYQGKIMDRLLCGDVGYGKTEVALRAAFRVIAEGKQAAILAPTTILARQHLATAKKRMEEFGVKIAALTRFESQANIKRTLEELKAGKIDLVIGTHRLLSKDVEYKDLGLLVLDEEQRFGVADKEKIKLIKKDINVLTLSATPIPRTLHLSLIGVRDISLLDTPPNDRIPVQTFVSEYTEGLVEAAINRELTRGGKVFVVYNRVEFIDKLAYAVSELAPNARVVVAHGQMESSRLEKAIDSFVYGDSDILVASAIVENGLDIPVANTMIVVDADKLGLSQLYQLRGRVGRSNRIAYVYFTYDGRKSLTDTAYKRLEAITQFTQFGSGFRIAMRDLEIRGAGNVMGREQHGHMERVGYDMYCKLLAEAVAELKGESTGDSDREIKTVIDFNAYLPKNYIVSDNERMEMYSKIATLSNIQDKTMLLSEMRDIYGVVPQPAVNLVGVGLVKNLARKAGASTVRVTKANIALVYDRAESLSKDVYNLANSYGASLKIDRSPVLDFGAKGSYEKFVRFLVEVSGSN